MGCHESPVAELDRHEADRLRARALELVGELDGIAEDFEDGQDRIWRWAGAASVILKELARG